MEVVGEIIAIVVGFGLLALVCKVIGEHIGKKRDEKIEQNQPIETPQKPKITIHYKDRPSQQTQSFLNRCDSIIKGYTSNIPCKDEIMKYIKKTTPPTFQPDNVEKQAHFVIMNRCAELLSSGEYHFHAASLNPIGELILSVYNSTSEWLLNNEYITQNDFDECKQILRKNIQEVG